jgi:aryl-alcohol dehydrogenase-like predicted oxidoreductase
MNYSYLGNSGLRVSDFCLGTMTFGIRTDEKEAQRIVSAALEAGVSFFDTADTYGKGESERILGKALGRRRSEVVLATKFSNPTGSSPTDSGWSRVHLMKAVEESLKRLGTDYIDIYYIHHTDDNTPLEIVLRGLDDLVSQGKVRYIGCSNFEAWRLSDALWTSRHHGFEQCRIYQGAYSLVMRDIEEELFPIIEKNKLGLVAFWNLAAGFLSGTHKPGERKVPGTRSAEGWIYHDEHFHPKADEILKVLLDVSEELGCSPAAAAIAWVRSKPQVAAALIGVRTLEQLEKNLPAEDLELPPEAVERLDSVSQLGRRYPRWMEENMQDRRDAALN